MNIANANPNSAMMLVAPTSAYSQPTATQVRNSWHQNNETNETINAGAAQNATYSAVQPLRSPGVQAAPPADASAQLNDTETREAHVEQMGLAGGGQEELVSYELTEKAHVVANELRDRFSDPVEALLLPARDYEPEEEVLEKMPDPTKPAIAEALALARERRTREAVAQPFSSQAQQTTATGPAASAGGRGSNNSVPMRNAQGVVMRHLRQQADGASPQSTLWMANGSASRANAGYPGGQPENHFSTPRSNNAPPQRTAYSWGSGEYGGGDGDSGGVAQQRFIPPRDYD